MLMAMNLKEIMVIWVPLMLLIYRMMPFAAHKQEKVGQKHTNIFETKV